MEAFSPGALTLYNYGTNTGSKLYFKGTEYRLSLSFSNDYPFKPPEVKFETSCFHILMWMYMTTFVWTFFRTNGHLPMMLEKFYSPSRVFLEIKNIYFSNIDGGDWFISVCHSSIAIGQGLVYGGDLSRVAVRGYILVLSFFYVDSDVQYMSRKLSDPRKQQDYEVKTTIDIKSSH
ncbi:hypothetical protein F8388_004638, partial [Cannabis sativa]